MYNFIFHIFKKCEPILFACLMSLSLSFPAFAADPCAGVDSKFYGLCNAYCNAKHCGTPQQNGSDNSCNVIKDNFFKSAGIPLPCIAAPSISVVKKTDGFTYDPSNTLKLLVGTPVTWTYTISNTGTIPVSITSILDSASIGANPVVSCEPGALPVNLAPGATLSCSANGTVQAGTYVNTVSVSATANGVTKSAESNGSYLGVEPGIVIQSSAPAAVPSGSAYSINYTVSNTGGTPLSNIVYSDDALGVPPNCPTALDVGASASCLSSLTAPTILPGGSATINDSITATSQFTDSNGVTKSTSDTATASITVIPPVDPVVHLLNNMTIWGAVGTTFPINVVNASPNKLWYINEPNVPRIVIVEVSSVNPVKYNFIAQSTSGNRVCEDDLVPLTTLVTTACPAIFSTGFTSGVTLGDLQNYIQANNGGTYTVGSQ